MPLIVKDPVLVMIIHVDPFEIADIVEDADIVSLDPSPFALPVSFIGKQKRAFPAVVEPVSCQG